MSIHHINDTHIRTQTAGAGAPLVLVHGGWAEASSWDAVLPLLAEDAFVVAYDRRGYGGSGCASGEWLDRRIHEDDLAALIEALDRGPVDLVANSYGGLVALGLAARRPDLVKSVSAHEPPAIGVADGGELSGLVDAVVASLARVVAEVGVGRVELGTRRFMEEIALGPGAWDQLPVPMRHTFMANARTVMLEVGAPEWWSLDLAAIDAYPGEVVISYGDAGPAWLPLLAQQLVEGIPHANPAVITGAGHAPHLTHPEEFVRLARERLLTATA